MKEDKRRVFNKKSQSEIITTVLIILLVLAAIIIVWNVVSNLITDSSEEIKEQTNPVFIQVDNFILYSNGTADVKVYFGSGEEKIEKLQFVFEDENGQTKVIIRENIDLKLKETKVYRFTQAEVGLQNVVKVTVIPIYGSNKEGIPDEKEVKKATINPVILNCYDQILGNPDLIAYYSLEGNANDVSGNGNNGTVTNAVFNSTGKFNGAYTFDGNGDYISRTNTILTSSYPFTMSAWFIKNTTAEGNIFILESDADTPVNYGIGASTKGILYADPGDTPYFALGTTNIRDNKWHHIVGVFNSDTDKRLYIDGVNEVDLTDSIPYDSTYINLVVVGFSNKRMNYFNGSIDEIAIFNKGLNSVEIQDLYNCYS